MILLILKILICSFVIVNVKGSSECISELECKNNGEDCSDLPEGSSQEYIVTFNTSVILNEYIITFKFYYMPSTRHNFLKSALNNINVSNWKVLQRSNPATAYPSDFEVLQITEYNNLLDLSILKKHPAIKSVTPHHLVRRILSYKYYNNSQSSENIFNKSVEKNKTFGSWNSGRYLLRAFPRQITTILRANVLWDMGITGNGVKVAVFDTGLSKGHPHFRRVKERTNWTNEKSLDDGVSHGTFVAGVIASAEECLGFAPDADLHIYRVFTNTQVSYTSWFLDAFNYAMIKKINILNLSIGGPDFLDYPFVEKVLELSANKVIMVSAIGNDGPLYGTLNNPGDQSDVIGVGGINFDENVAKFSSRGMTTWELPRGYGRLKPDIVTYGSQVKGSNIKGGCRSLSGTSVASPVVAGAVTLIASGVLHNLKIVNPASMKQVLLEGSTRLADNNMFEQGHGKLNILKSMELLASYIPKVTLSPPYLDFSETYMWPYSSQSLYCGCAPIIVNVTILNGISVTGFILKKPKWNPNLENHGSFLNMSINVSPILWPWSGWMSVYIAVNKNGCNYEGVASGCIELLVQSQSASDKNVWITSTVNFPINVKIIPKPPRHKRILWDQYHSLRYPPGYLPRDNLKIKSDPLDWNADHIHTNFRDMYNHLRNSGYYVDVLREPFNCFTASDYGTILIVDPEEEYFDEEIFKLQNDVYNHNLSIIVFADWYNTTVMKRIKFFDENTRQWWIPDTGGANIPALNELLEPFGIALGDFVAEGYYTMGDHSMYYASGSVIAQFPKSSDSILISANLHDQGLEIINNVESDTNVKYCVPILGLLHTTHVLQSHYTRINSTSVKSSYEDNTIDQSDNSAVHSVARNPILNKRILLKYDMKKKADTNGIFDKFDSENDINDSNQNNDNKHSKQPHSQGRIAVFGDSNCLDSTHLEKPCYWLLDALLEFTMNSHVSSLLKDLNVQSKQSKFKSFVKNRLPLRLVTSNLHIYSKVLDVDNMFKKRAIEKCENLQWAMESSNHTESKLFFKEQDKIRGNEDTNKKLLRKLESKKGVVFDDRLKNLEEQFIYDSQGTFEDDLIDKNKNLLGESLNYAMLFIVMLTLIMLALFIVWLKLQRCKRFRLQHVLNQIYL